MTKAERNAIPGRKSGKLAFLLGGLAIVTCLIPLSGAILGWFGMKKGEQSRKEGGKVHGTFGLLATLVSGLGFFLGLLMITACITVVFLTATDIINIGAVG